jgi:hypothetical protein
LERHYDDTPMRTLGRIFVPDERDKRWPMSALLVGEPEVTSRYWDDETWWGDQGETSQCVGYSWAHWIEDGPVLHLTEREAPPLVHPADIYHRAQQIDEWNGEDYEGTSVRAGAEALRERGLISEYRWAWNATTVGEVILSVGPVVVGTLWTNGMFYPDGDGYKIHPTGDVAGGHAYVINGYDSETRLFRIKNSWGRSWGDDGSAYISFEDLDWLLQQNGEACLAIELTGAVEPEPDLDVEPVPDPEPTPEPEPTPDPIPEPEPVPDPVPLPDAEIDWSFLDKFFDWVGRVWRRLFG